jgi:hypothetical protein
VEIDWRELCVAAGRPQEAYRPVCGKPLVVHHHFTSGRGPPSWFQEREAGHRVA